MKNISETSRKIAFSSVLSAMSIAVLIAGVLPGTMMISIMVAISISLEILDNYGIKYWAMWYIVVSIISIMINPDLEIKASFICLAWYTPAKSFIDTLPKLLRIVAKFIIYLSASFMIYEISILLFGDLEVELSWFVYVCLAVFMVEFLILDIILNMARNTIIPTIHKRFKNRH